MAASTAASEDLAIAVVAVRLADRFRSKKVRVPYQMAKAGLYGALQLHRAGVGITDLFRVQDVGGQLWRAMKRKKQLMKVVPESDIDAAVQEVLAECHTKPPKITRPYTIPQPPNLPEDPPGVSEKVWIENNGY